ncbi:ribosomal protein L13e [Tritrichomonas foetus]|uniref:Ribosomal protein L13e n=1 Tax=Tritrichomonas foetus TaxID=1144522 RepID=A0A1J4KES8_9EUKA|nr:ribosomal protein L13e [Tritrichomonas foetus]OHT08268.1 ribosomal protein L13e [Tritrichomonas foetus]|eukprot:OHT08268.1 ribosomal protein L13e [Tritrichomonas foetus]
MVCKNNMVPNDHLRKAWYKRVKTYFDDPARKVRRQTARANRAKKIAPRPIEGPLRPVVHCPTARYNRRIRLGRGFTREELVAAGFDPSRAPFMGVAVDHFRTHSTDSLKQVNVDRLTAYKNKMVRVHTKTEKLPASVPQPALFALNAPEKQVQWRVIKAEETKTNLFKAKRDAHKAWRQSIKAKEEAKRKK